jgi:hypothetical protein
MPTTTYHKSFLPQLRSREYREIFYWKWNYVAFEVILDDQVVNTEGDVVSDLSHHPFTPSSALHATRFSWRFWLRVFDLITRVCLVYKLLGWCRFLFSLTFVALKSIIRNGVHEEQIHLLRTAEYACSSTLYRATSMGELVSCVQGIWTCSCWIRPDRNRRPVFLPKPRRSITGIFM